MRWQLGNGMRQANEIKRKRPARLKVLQIARYIFIFFGETCSNGSFFRTSSSGQPQSMRNAFCMFASRKTISQHLSFAFLFLAVPFYLFFARVFLQSLMHSYTQMKEGNLAFICN